MREGFAGNSPSDTWLADEATQFTHISILGPYASDTGFRNHIIMPFSLKGAAYLKTRSVTTAGFFQRVKEVKIKVSIEDFVLKCSPDCIFQLRLCLRQ